MPYKIKDAEGSWRFNTDDMPIEQKDLAEDYMKTSQENWGHVYPAQYPFTLVEVE